MGKCQIWQKLAKNGQKTPKITWACGKVKLGTPVSVKKALPGGSELSEMLLKLQQFMYELVGFGGVFWRLFRIDSEGFLEVRDVYLYV